MSALLQIIIVSIVAPSVLGLITAWVARNSKNQQWERDDKVADRLAAAQAATIVKTEEVAKAVISHNTVVDTKLDQIHTLVNSQMTTAITNERDALVSRVLMMREVVELKKGNGLEPTAETLASIKEADTRIKDLNEMIAEREHQQKIVEDQAAAGAAEKSPTQVVVVNPEPVDVKVHEGKDPDQVQRE